MAYDTVCATWWGPSGHVQGWFSRYKIFLINEARGYETNDTSIVTQMQIMDLSSAGYRPTFQIEAARRYAEKGRIVFQDRPGTDITTGWMR